MFGTPFGVIFEKDNNVNIQYNLPSVPPHVTPEGVYAMARGGREAVTVDCVGREPTEKVADCTGGEAEAGAGKKLLGRTMAVECNDTVLDSLWKARITTSFEIKGIGQCKFQP
uniref:Uncharacterized protein n=1 Tax=Oryza brachyantha TaxID=4533 RepID=J3NCP2_ORYBR